MQYGAIWVPRSVTHFREFPKMLETADRLSDRDVATEYPVYSSYTDEGYDEVGRMRFNAERDGHNLTCRFTQIGMLVVEGKEEMAEKELLSLAKDIYVHLAEQKWSVLAEQVNDEYVPFGEAAVILDEFDPAPIFEEVCHDYLHKCLDQSRGYDVETQNERITDVLQRIEQAQACYEYMHEVQELDSPDLRHHLEYAHALISMLSQNVRIKSERHRERQLRNLEIIVVILTIVIVAIEFGSIVLW